MDIMTRETAALKMIQGYAEHSVAREHLSDYLSVVSMEDIPWAVNFLLSKLAVKKEATAVEEHHIWDDYELSPEIQALSSFERKVLPDDYKQELTEILGERYK